MELSPKAIRFLIDAVKHYQEHLEQRLEEAALSDDQLADLTNDRQFLLALEHDLRSRHGELLGSPLPLQG